MFRRLCRLSFLGLAFALLSPAVLLADEEAVRQALQDYVAAFNKQDLETVTAFWSENATHVDTETGERTEGRNAILADVKTSFSDQPDLRLLGQVEKVRMIKADVAQVTGQTTISSPDSDPIESRFSAILVMKEDKWVIDSIEEGTVPQPPSAHDALTQLEWLIGRWVDKTEDARVDTTVRWSPNEAFLIRSFKVSKEDGVLYEGTEVIGWDPRAQQIRSWRFDSDGSFGDGVWSQHEEDWLIKSTQTLADGSAASGTYVITPVDADTLKFQLVAHEVEGEPRPSSEAITVVRIPVESDEAAAASTEASEAATESTGSAKP